MRIVLVVLLALAAPAFAEEPPTGAVAIPAAVPASPALAELRRLPLRRHTMEEGGNVSVNLTSLGKDHMLALAERRGLLSLHFLASGVGTTVAIPILDFGSGPAEEVVAPPLGRRTRGDDVLYFIRRDDHEVAVFRVGDQLRIAVRDRAGWQVRRTIKLARGTKLLAIANTFPH